MPRFVLNAHALDTQRTAYNSAIEDLTDAYYAAWGGRLAWAGIAVAHGMHIPLPEPADAHAAQALPSPLNALTNWNQARLCNAATALHGQLGAHVHAFPNTPTAGNLVQSAINKLNTVIYQTC